MNKILCFVTLNVFLCCCNKNEKQRLAKTVECQNVFSKRDSIKLFELDTFCRKLHEISNINPRTPSFDFMITPNPMLENFSLYISNLYTDDNINLHGQLNFLSLKKIKGKKVKKEITLSNKNVNVYYGEHFSIKSSKACSILNDLCKLKTINSGCIDFPHGIFRVKIKTETNNIYFYELSEYIDSNDDVKTLFDIITEKVNKHFEKNLYR